MSTGGQVVPNSRQPSEFDKLQVDKLHGTLFEGGGAIDAAMSLMLTLLATTAIFAFAAPLPAKDGLVEIPVIGIGLDHTVASVALLLLSCAASLKFFLLLAAHEDIARILGDAVRDAYGQDLKSYLRVDYPSGLWALIVLVRQTTAESLGLWQAGFWLVFGLLLPVTGLALPAVLTAVITEGFQPVPGYVIRGVVAILLVTAGIAYLRFFVFHFEELRALKARERLREAAARVVPPAPKPGQMAAADAMLAPSPPASDMDHAPKEQSVGALTSKQSES